MNEEEKEKKLHALKIQRLYKLAKRKLFLGILMFIASIGVFVGIYILFKRELAILLERKPAVSIFQEGETLPTIDASQRNVIVEDETGVRFVRKDGTYADDGWYEVEGKLYYFTTQGYALNSELLIDGQKYIFNNKGVLTNIEEDKEYFKEEPLEDRISEVKSNSLTVFLDRMKRDETYYGIKFKRSTEEKENYLGSETDIQYASAYMIQIKNSSIYYLAVGKKTAYSGRLYEMVPNAKQKNAYGTNVTGFLVLDTGLWFCDNGAVIKATSSEVLPVNSTEEKQTDPYENIKPVDDDPIPEPLNNSASSQITKNNQNNTKSTVAASSTSSNEVYPGSSNADIVKNYNAPN